MEIPRIALTVGEPAGIGVDITLKIAQLAIAADIVAFADPDLLKQRAKQLNLEIKLIVTDESLITTHVPGTLKVKPIQLRQPVHCGQLNPANAAYVLETLQQACQSCVHGEFDALVTAPVHKGVINEAGIKFSGHTEFLAQQTNTKQVVMMLATPGLRVALATTHLPLAQVSAAITEAQLETTIRIIHHDLRTKLGIAQPRIAVCGLNPHAGEDGHLGREEITLINPLLERLRQTGFDIIGTISADTAFTTDLLACTDVILCMYHDQGLPVLKYKGFGQAVNITLGLPIIRTSVDHGTALTLAGTGLAQSGSLSYAIQVALEMIHSVQLNNTI